MIQDVMVTNGWYLEGLPSSIGSGSTDAHPHFETLEGVSFETESVTAVDAISGRVQSFSGQLMKNGPITLTRTFQANIDDYSLQVIVTACQKQGLKMNLNAVKMHFQVKVFELFLEGFRFEKNNFPTLDTNAENEKFTVTYNCTVDAIYLVPLQFNVDLNPPLNPAVQGNQIG